MNELGLIALVVAAVVIVLAIAGVVSYGAGALVAIVAVGLAVLAGGGLWRR